MGSLPLSPMPSSDHLIEQWLTERQELLVTFFELCQHRPFIQSPVAENVTTAMQLFCQQLMDYLSLGHFRIFEQVTKVIELSLKRSRGVHQYLIASIAQCTQLILNFNDKYEVIGVFDSLEEDLSQLSNTIAQLLESEDRLIGIYYRARTRECYVKGSYSSKYCNLSFTPFHFSASGKASL
jgi:regulator of sigma D